VSQIAIVVFFLMAVVIIALLMVLQAVFQMSLKMRRAIMNLYEAGCWRCQDVTEDRQRELWEQLRDAAGIKEGTATKLGVHDGRVDVIT